MFVGTDGEDKLSLLPHLIIRKYKLVASGGCHKVKSAQKKNRGVGRPSPNDVIGALGSSSSWGYTYFQNFSGKWMDKFTSSLRQVWVDILSFVNERLLTLPFPTGLYFNYQELWFSIQNISCALVYPDPDAHHPVQVLMTSYLNMQTLSLSLSLCFLSFYLPRNCPVNPQQAVMKTVTPLPQNFYWLSAAYWIKTNLVLPSPPPCVSFTTHAEHFTSDTSDHQLWGEGFPHTKQFSMTTAGCPTI